MQVQITRIRRNGEREVLAGNLNPGDVVLTQGDVCYTWEGLKEPKGFVATNFRSIVAAHGESQNTHVMEAVDRATALQWLHEATAAPTALTQFAYNQLQPGTKMFVGVPEVDTVLNHEEHDSIEFNTAGIYGITRQFETRGARRENVYD